LNWFIFPPAGWGTWRHVVLPGVTLGTVYAAYIARLTRGGMLEVTRADFVKTAWAKGLAERAIVVRHMLKGGLLPVVTFLGPAVASMMVGSVVVEKIFATPGLGPYFVDAAFNRDYFLVMGIVVYYSVFLLLMNLVVDIAYGFLDPRIRYD
jgi:oligopeptide transport system permease protein